MMGSVWEQITRPSCRVKTVGCLICHFMVQMSAYTVADFSVDYYPQVKATGSLWKGHLYNQPTFMASSACRKLLLSVASWVCFTSSCQEGREIWDGVHGPCLGVLLSPDDDEHSRQSDVQERSRAGGHLSLSHALITPTHNRENCLPTI